MVPYRSGCFVLNERQSDREHIFVHSPTELLFSSLGGLIPEPCLWSRVLCARAWTLRRRFSHFCTSGTGYLTGFWHWVCLFFQYVRDQWVMEWGCNKVYLSIREFTHLLTGKFGNPNHFRKLDSTHIDAQLVERYKDAQYINNEIICTYNSNAVHKTWIYQNIVCSD